MRHANFTKTKNFMVQSLGALGFVAMLFAPFSALAGVTITNSQCPAPSGCDNSAGGSTLWPGVGNFSVCNTSIAPWTLYGFRWKANYNGWTTYGGPAVTKSGSNPTTYEQRVSTTDRVLRAAFCLNSYSLGGSVPAATNGQPYDFDLLIKNGSCSPVAPFPTPTPMTCTDVVNASNQAAFYDSSLCIQNWLGKNGGIDSGGMINTFYGQTQIQLAKPASGWSVNTDPITWDPYGGMGNSPLYLMANAAGQEYLNIDMMFICGIGSKESKAANLLSGVTPLFIPNNAAGVAGTYHVENTTFAAIVAAYPGFFPDYACIATYPDVTSAIGTACMPGTSDPLYHYMSQAGYTAPYLSNNSAQLVNSVFAVSMNMYRLYDALLASKDLCFQNLLENGHDPLAAIKIIPAGYNLGINSGFQSGALPPGAGVLAAADITSYTAAGNSNYRDDVLRTATNLSNASASCPHSSGVFDAPITLTDLQTFFFGNGGTVGAQGDGGLLRQFAISAADRTSLWNDVTCAFNALKGRAPSGYGASAISYRYDFLSILRVARQYFRLQRAFPTQSDFTDWVTNHSAGGGAACGLVADDTYPTYTALSLAQNAQVCPGFPVTLTVTDNVGVSGVDWSLDSDWLQWQPATGGPSNFSFTVPGSTAGFPANGATGKLWIRAYDDCGNQTVRQVDFVHNCGTPTYTATRTATRTPTATASPTASPSPSRTPSPTPSATPSPSATPTVSPTRTASPSASPSPSASYTASPASTATHTPTASPTPTVSPSPSASPTRSPSPSSTASPSPSPVATATGTPSASPSPSATLSWSPSATPPGTLTDTPTFTHSPTATPSATSTATFSGTPSHSATRSASPTGTWSVTESPTPSKTASATLTPSATLSPSFSETASRTASPSATPSLTATPSFTPSRTWSDTPTSTPSATLSPSFTETPTFTVSPTVTPTYDKFFQQEKLIKVRGLYPNPFSDKLRIYYTLRVEAQVACRIYDVAGEPIKVVEQRGQAGKNEMEWFGDNESGGRCASGIYILHVDAHGVDGTVDDFWDQAAVAR